MRCYELGESDWFTYVPPFRGRAIRMLKRDVPFEELEIDFEALEKRKAAEYDKLNRMVRFALSGACRQQEILHYFGEGEAGPCNHCDNCSKHGRRDRPSDRAANARNRRRRGDAHGGQARGRRSGRGRRDRGRSHRAQRRRPRRVADRLRQEPHRPDALRFQFGQRSRNCG